MVYYCYTNINRSFTCAVKNVFSIVFLSIPRCSMNVWNMYLQNLVMLMVNVATYSLHNILPMFFRPQNIHGSRKLPSSCQDFLPTTVPTFIKSEEVPMAKKTLGLQPDIGHDVSVPGLQITDITYIWYIDITWLCGVILCITYFFYILHIFFYYYYFIYLFFFKYRTLWHTVCIV